jgi:hypothetical protein
VVLHFLTITLQAQCAAAQDKAEHMHYYEQQTTGEHIDGGAGGPAQGVSVHMHLGLGCSKIEIRTYVSAIMGQRSVLSPTLDYYPYEQFNTGKSMKLGTRG